VLWAGVFAFAIQIYADFSAYTDIARGSSRWLGFELTENFDHPYLARNPADFWRRWNISLSTWFRDYVYIPLGGSRSSEWIWARNVMITFLLSGLWHGASWNYVLWGLYHGVLLVITRAHQILKPPKAAAHRTSRIAPLAVVQTAGMFALTLLGWLLFRETELSAIVRDLRLAPWNSSSFERQAGLYLFLLAFGYSIPLWTQSIWVELHRGLIRPEGDGRELGSALLKAIACGAAFTAILVLRSRTSLDFIYFQF
jgi:D-alanyl-lipoteichoic acid acyltransferase DltB (MBOAT superfamily)